MDKKHFVIFIGRSGSGKSTQIDLFEDYLNKTKNINNLFRFSTGAAFREFVNRDNYSGEKSKAIIDRGGLMPEFLAVWNWANILVENLKQDTNVVSDGTPRQLFEAQALESAIKFYDFKRPVVVYLDLKRDIAIERLSKREEGREDDKQMSTIVSRMDWFDEKVVPVVEYYKSNAFYKVIHVNGDDTVENIFENIKKEWESQ